MLSPIEHYKTTLLSGLPCVTWMQKVRGSCKPYPKPLKMHEGPPQHQVPMTKRQTQVLGL